jgi:hypothetical protein
MRADTLRGYREMGGGVDSAVRKIYCTVSSVAGPGCLSRIPDPTFFHPGSRIRIKEFKYFNPKKWFLRSRKYDPGCSSLTPDLDADFLPIPDPGSRGQKGTGSRIRIRNTDCEDSAVKFTYRTAPTPHPPLPHLYKPRNSGQCSKLKSQTY